MLRGETYGYKLIKDVTPYIDVSESTLYPILRRLEAAGNVTVRSAEHNGRLRKYYSITAEGKHKIKNFLKDWEEIRKVCDYIKETYEND